MSSSPDSRGSRSTNAFDEKLTAWKSTKTDKCKSTRALTNTADSDQHQRTIVHDDHQFVIQDTFKENEIATLNGKAEENFLSEPRELIHQASSTVATEPDEDLPELRTTIQKPSPQGFPVDEGFAGMAINLADGDSTFPIKNDMFEGGLKILLRDNPYCTYDFNGDKDVIWELQMQGKFRRIPKGPIYLALEIPQREKLNVTLAMRAILKASMQLMRAMGIKDVHTSYGGEGGDDLPHMASPAFHSFDRVVITKEGEKPPTLGTFLPKMPSDIQRRKNFFKTNHVIDTSCTYTFSIKNRRFNPMVWKVVKVPIVKSFNVSKYTDDLRLSMYEVLQENNKPIDDTKGSVSSMAKKRHTKKNTFMWIQMSRGSV
mmetsp:Transcript_7421/g.10614  ORF Transcript_7421/g.10614 Transcript_7421/m.10614 type:complete len:372 (+) Transcript_7421:70-1185(+)|eukprot:CAMPEP_0184857628 /NCGR_PEP_ID=MMETSP0580-20130426/2782_1 /TAXON_ID=1118495 /ORGANISM="Dactyliosolen fragilissimus" /LENGTH=371 /DNA_ID=CAMNT_0027353335 /DNA_START=12 /DNA_END=1127 /DNA_ORIENTATION=-